MTPVRLEDTVVLHVGTANPSTGAAQDADSTPVVTVEEDGVAMGYAPAVANVATGLYRVTIAATTGNGFEVDKRYSVYVTATVGGVTGRDGIAEFGTIDDIVDAVWDEVLTGATHNVPASSGRRLRTVAAAVAFSGTINGTPTSTVIPLDASASTEDNFYRPGMVVIESSFGIQFRRTASYVGGATKELTLATPLTLVPSNGDAVTIYPWVSVRVSEMDPGVIDVVVAPDLPTNDDMVAYFAALNDPSVDEIWAKVIDGSVDATTAFMHLLSMASGNVVKTGDAYAYKNRAGSTLFTLTIGDTTRVRS